MERAPDARGSAGDVPSALPATRKPRVWFVDVVRLLASFQMINGHTLDAVMVESVRQGALYERYLGLRGLVSVAFLSVAGIAFYLSTVARFDAHRSNPAAIRRRYRRALIIIGFGYFLEVPTTLVKVLHCIGFSLLVLETLTLLARRPRQVVVASGVIAAAVVACAPLVDRLGPGAAPSWLFDWISHRGGSHFPLFPWAGYVFAGVVLGALVFPRGAATDPDGSIRRLVLLAAAGWAAWMVLDLSPWATPTGTSTVSVEPAFTVGKLAAVTALVGVLAVLCRPVERLPRVLRTLSAETLTIYVFHLMVLFAPWPGIGAALAHSLSLPAALGVVAFMMVITCGYAVLWHETKRWARRRFART